MAVEDIPGALYMDIKENYTCPICSNTFRRKIESWMKFKCKDCGKDLCKETDINLYSGQCPDCSWKEFNTKKSEDIKIEKEIVINKEKETVVEEKPKIQKGLDKWF